MNVLVSGGCGYIGSVLCEVLTNSPNFNVTVIDNLMYKQDGLLNIINRSNLDFVYGDVRDNKLLSKWADWADVVIPLAAIVGFPACERDKTGAKEINHLAIEYLSHICAVKNKKILYANTNSGYGVTDGQSECNEETPLNPITTYGVTKCEAEYAVLDAGGIAFRLATVFGVSPRMRLDLLVNDFTFKAVTDGYIVLFEKDFKRNYIHVRDVCSAFLKMINEYDQYKGQVFNLGLSSANLSKWELAQVIKKYVPNFSIQVDDIATDPDKRNYIVSNEKMEKTGWRPQYTLDAGIQELIKSYQIVKNVHKKYANV